MAKCEQDSKVLAQTIANLLEDKKGEDVLMLDLREKEYIVDFVIIATAMVGRHSSALLDHLKSELKPKNVKFYVTDEDVEDWIVADLGAIMVHIFTHNHRKKFNLEEFLSSLPTKTSFH